MASNTHTHSISSSSLPRIFSQFSDTHTLTHPHTLSHTLSRTHFPTSSMHACLRQRVLNVKTVKRRPNNQNKSRKKKERKTYLKKLSSSERTNREKDRCCMRVVFFFFSTHNCWHSPFYP
jgi:hypothetical protein